jgi:hypothetical protein
MLNWGLRRRALNSVRITVELDERKAAANRKKHRVAFESMKKEPAVKRRDELRRAPLRE